MSDVLVLNFSYEALNQTSLRRAVRMVFGGKAEVVEANGELRSPTIAVRLPSVIRMLYYVKRKRKRVALTKKNVLLRDKHLCQYCGVEARQLTVDHVHPKSRGGPSAWTNHVAACDACNARKRNRTPAEAGMQLRRLPREPHHIPWLSIRRHTAPGEWSKYLFYSLSIDERIEA